MVKIMVEVSNEIAKKFSGREYVKYEEILDYEDNLKYTFMDEKVNFNELSEFIDKTISTKSKKVC